MSVIVSVILNFFLDAFKKIWMITSFKIAIVIAFTTMFVAAVYAYIQASRLIIEALSVTIPVVAQGVAGWVLPDNANACLTVIVSSIMLRFFTMLYWRLMNLRVNAALSR
jgi:ABC-type bacteriocin/lantibiotic exporter with double-glycine peptidase domain